MIANIVISLVRMCLTLADRVLPKSGFAALEAALFSVAPAVKSALRLAATAPVVSKLPTAPLAKELGCALSAAVPELSVVRAPVDWWYVTGDDGRKSSCQEPHIRCPVRENGEECRAVAMAARFTTADGVECGQLLTDHTLFPTYMCDRHIDFLPRFRPDLASTCRPSHPSRFSRPVPVRPGYTEDA